jgi:hypothetical protein
MDGLQPIALGPMTRGLEVHEGGRRDLAWLRLGRRIWTPRFILICRFILFVGRNQRTGLGMLVEKKIL